MTVSYTQDHIIGAKCTCQTGHMFRFAYWYCGFFFLLLLFVLSAHVAAVLMSLVKSRDTALSTETIKDIVKKLPKEVVRVLFCFVFKPSLLSHSSSWKMR